jgi:hypothetical protein
VNELKLDEHALDDGSLGSTVLRLEEEGLSLEEDGARLGLLPPGAVEAVMERFGRALADDVAPQLPGLTVGAGASLHALRHLARYDVIARDYVVLVRPGRDSLVSLSTTVAGALRHLARAAAGAQHVVTRP